MEKRSFADGWLLTFIPLRNTLYWSPQALMPHSGSLGRVLPSQWSRGKSSPRWYTWTHESGQSLSRINTRKSLWLTLLLKVRWLGACWKSNVYPLSLWEITPLIIWLFKVMYQAVTLYQLADGSAVVKLGLDGILDGISGVSTYHEPHIGHQFIVVGFTSPSLGDGSSTGPIVMWIKNSTIAALVL